MAYDPEERPAAEELLESRREEAKAQRKDKPEKEKKDQHSRKASE